MIKVGGLNKFYKQLIYCFFKFEIQNLKLGFEIFAFLQEFIYYKHITIETRREQMIKIALSNNIHDTKSIRKKMKMLWNIFCRHVAMSSMPLPITFLSADTEEEVHFTVSGKDAAYTLLIPPLSVVSIVQGFRSDVLPTDTKMQILGIIFQELSKRVIRFEYLSKSMPKGIFRTIQDRATEVILTSTNAEVALMAEDHGPPLKVMKDLSDNKITIMFMYTRHKDTLIAHGFFNKLIQQGWMFC